MNTQNENINETDSKIDSNDLPINNKDIINVNQDENIKNIEQLNDVNTNTTNNNDDKEKNNKHKYIIALIILILIVIVLGYCYFKFFNSDNQNDDINNNINEEEINNENDKENDLEEDDDDEKINIMQSRADDEKLWKYTNDIEKIIFSTNNNPIENAIEIWDLSQKNDSSVIGYLSKGKNNSYVVYIKADGVIYLPSDSSNLFGSINEEDAFTNLEEIENFKYINTSLVTDMSYMFTNDKSLSSLDLNKWDTSNVDNMSYLFDNTSNLKSLKINKWDTSLVTDMSYMFSGTKNLGSLDISSWNVQNVIDMNHMFSYMSKIKKINLGKWDTSNVEDMSSMFCDSNLESIDIKSWDTSKVKYMSNMFNGAKNLTNIEININNKLDSYEGIFDEVDAEIIINYKDSCEDIANKLVEKYPNIKKINQVS